MLLFQLNLNGFTVSVLFSLWEEKFLKILHKAVKIRAEKIIYETWQNIPSNNIILLAYLLFVSRQTKCF